MNRIDDLSRQDGALLMESLCRVVRDSRALTAELLAHLAVADARRLHLQEACPSLHDYCVRRLGLDEETAWRYVGVARLVVRFPILLDLLAAGELHVSGIRLIAPWLRDERADDAAQHELIRAACGRTRKQIAAMLAERFPLRSVPPTVTPLPCDGDVVCGDGRVSGTPDGSQHLGAIPQEGARGAAELGTPGGALLPELQASRETAEELDQSGIPPLVSPLGARRYRVQFTASEALVARIDEAQALLSHTVAAGDLAALIALALDALCKQTLKRRFGVGSRCKGAARTDGAPEPVTDVGRAQGSGAPAQGDRLDPDPVAGAAERTPASAGGGPLDPDPVAGGDFAVGICTWEQSGPLDPDPVAGGDLALGICTGEQGGPLDPDPVEPAGSAVPASNARTGRVGAPVRIPLKVRAEVYIRDGGRCTFVDAAGRRCESRSFLQLDHVTMACRGGAPAVDNCRLLCGPHNRAEARRLLGDDFVDQKIRGRAERSRRVPPPARRPVDRTMLRPADWAPDDPMLLQMLDALGEDPLSIEDLGRALSSSGSQAEVMTALLALEWQQRVVFLPGRRTVARTDQAPAWESPASSDLDGASETPWEGRSTLDELLAASGTELPWHWQ